MVNQIFVCVLCFNFRVINKLVKVNHTFTNAVTRQTTAVLTEVPSVSYSDLQKNTTMRLVKRDLTLQYISKAIYTLSMMHAKYGIWNIGFYLCKSQHYLNNMSKHRQSFNNSREKKFSLTQSFDNYHIKYTNFIFGRTFKYIAIL